MTYRPKPIDVSDVSLDLRLESLIEKLAENTHEVWAAQRLADGWSYGPQRNDEKRHHPCLIPYVELSEEEKEYDRMTARDVVRLLLKLGCQIDTGQSRSVTSVQAHGLLEELQAEAALTSKDIRRVWATHDPALWCGEPQIYLVLGEQALGVGEPLLAYDILGRGLETFKSVFGEPPEEPARLGIRVKMAQKQALSLAQAGMPELSIQKLEWLVSNGYVDSETSGLLGRCHKDLGLGGEDPQRHSHLETACAIYRDGANAARECGDLDGAYYNGINAATLALLMGSPVESRAMAAEVSGICREIMAVTQSNGAQPSHWLLASLGEAALLQEDVQSAATFYQQATELCQGRLRDVSSMRKQARLILQAQGKAGLLDKAFDVPAVMVFTGSNSQGEALRKPLARLLAQENAGVGYATLLGEEDLVFCEEILKRQGELNLVLPFDSEEVFERFFCGNNEGLRARFDAVLAAADRVHLLGRQATNSLNPLLAFSRLYVFGEALQRSRQQDLEFHALTGWEGQGDTVLGSSGWAVRQWQRIVEVGCLDEKGEPGICDSSGPQADMVATVVEVDGASHHAFQPMLFADVKGYSSLSEKQLLAFSQTFMARVGEAVREYDSHILQKRTIGDGLFLVFADLETAINCALSLNETTRSVDWSSAGLPAKLFFRIALDVGPCYSFSDPVTEVVDYCGDYVNRAARLEPATPPGEIFASETFVALSAAAGLDRCRFDYSGQIVLPKGFGVMPAYHLKG